MSAVEFLQAGVDREFAETVVSSTDSGSPVVVFFWSEGVGRGRWFGLVTGVRRRGGTDPGTWTRLENPMLRG